MTTLEDRLLDHAEALRFDALPAAAVAAAVTFITDSVAVGLAGSRHPRYAQVVQAARAWGHAGVEGAAHDGSRGTASEGARDWASGRRWPAPSAALLNAYQIHNQEFDCVHERAVVHPLATILPALVVQGETSAHPVSGARLIEAVVLAVDVAATIGSAQIAPMRFFRPAMCGALGAAIGVAKLRGATRNQMADAFGLAYSQLAGTMQAHLEGSPALALQVALASRAAVCAVDLALAGFSGPRQVIEGPFGYFDLFDAPLAPRRDAVRAVFDELQRTHRITEVSHKPFPTGRAAQGALDGVATLRAAHGFSPEQVAGIELQAPPLILRLVGRPWRADMDVNYARLCLPYLVSTLLLRGQVTLADFSAGALADASRRPLADRVRWRPNETEDPNALIPQRVEVTLVDGRELGIDLPAVLGHPARPLGSSAQREKFDACCRHAGHGETAIERLHAACLALPDAPHLEPWIDAMRVEGP